LLFISVSIKFSSSVGSGTPLISVSGGEIETRNLKFLHSGGSKGAYFSVTQGGAVVVNASQVTVDPLVGFVWWKECEGMK
jgi:hypothetical protein